MLRSRKPRKRCLVCKRETTRVSRIYCSIKCQKEYQYMLYIRNWKNGNVLGLQKSLGIVSGHVKRYLREKYDDKCSLCGWSRLNPYTQKVPLVADHIDGDWKNNIETNLRLICPNCDSLSSTYAGLNRGNGRRGRVVSRRVIESRLLND